MSGYTKLFNSILDSTIWDEDYETRLLWITMLAMVNIEGVVESSTLGLANRARIPLEKVREGLQRLTSPDPDSRTPDFDGRRIEKVDGGWKLLNYNKFRAIRDAEKRRDYMRLYMRHYRKPVNGGKVNQENVAERNKNLANLANADTEAYITPPISPPSQGGTVNFQDQEQKPNPESKAETLSALAAKKHWVRCMMPGCPEPAAPGQRFCSPQCEDYANYLLKSQGSKESA